MELVISAASWQRQAKMGEEEERLIPLGSCKILNTRPKLKLFWRQAYSKKKRPGLLEVEGIEARTLGAGGHGSQRC